MLEDLSLDSQNLKYFGIPRYGTCITTVLHSINVTRESNENGRFSARLGLAKLMSGREIESRFSRKYRNI